MRLSGLHRHVLKHLSWIALILLLAACGRDTQYAPVPADGSGGDLGDERDLGDGRDDDRGDQRRDNGDQVRDLTDFDNDGRNDDGQDIIDPYDEDDNFNPFPNPDPVVTPDPVGNPDPVTTSGITWKGVLMTGDDSINAFDNARRQIKQIWGQLGVQAGNTRELSRMASQQGGGVSASNRQNLQQAWSSLNIGPNDGCVMFMTSHGSRQGFYLRGQSTLSPAELDQILEQHCAGRPTVLLISACYSGVFISDSSMTRPNRVILTAARNDRTSFGCSAENQYTYWDGCLIQNLPNGGTWESLYGNIKSCIERKEGGNYTPSLPQSFFGSQMSNQQIFGDSGGSQAIF